MHGWGEKINRKNHVFQPFPCGNTALWVPCLRKDLNSPIEPMPIFIFQRFAKVKNGKNNCSSNTKRSKNNYLYSCSFHFRFLPPILIQPPCAMFSSHPRDSRLLWTPIHSLSRRKPISSWCAFCPTYGPKRKLLTFQHNQAYWSESNRITAKMMISYAMKPTFIQWINLWYKSRIFFSFFFFFPHFFQDLDDAK